MADLPLSMWDLRSGLFEMFRDALAGSEIRGRKAQVFEGTRTRGTTPDLFLLVGSPSALDDELTIANDPWGRLESTPDPMSVQWRINEGEIDCAAVAWSGSPGDRPSLRADVSAVVGTCERALVNDPRIGGRLDGENMAQIIGQEFRDPLTSKGPFAEVVFTVGYRQRAVF